MLKHQNYLLEFFCNQIIKEQAVWMRGDEAEVEDEEEEEEDTGRNAGVFPLFSALTLRVS